MRKLAPKFSIIIPTLNEEKYVGSLLDCLNAQTFKDFEVIVVDAHSQDATKETVERHKKDLNLQFVLSPKKGVSFQRNYGASLSQAEAFIFMDADLYINKDFLHKIYDYISVNPDTDILSTWLLPNSNEKIYKIFFGLYNIASNVAKRWVPVAVGAFMYCKKSVFIKLKGFDEKITLSEDFDLVLRAHKKKFKFVLLRNPQVYFSVRRMEKMGKTRYFLMAGRAAVYYPLKSIFKSSDWVGYKMEGGSAYEGYGKNDEIRTLP